MHFNPVSRGWKILRCALVATSIGLVSAEVTEATQAHVSLTVTGDREQPTGWPVVVELTLTNVGDDAIGWWCGGPDSYPGAEHFVVQVRYGAEHDWHDVAATNGQHVEGSGIGQKLVPGESTIVPLAIRTEKEGGVHIRIHPRNWHATDPAETYVQTSDDRRLIDDRRARAITATIMRKPPFWQHLAECYADDVVIDAMLKLATVDNAPSVAGAARLLARQQSIPKEAGDDFAELVRRWLPASLPSNLDALRENVVRAALLTQHESAREAVLASLLDAKDERSRWIAINALRLSPGDNEWLRRARDWIRAAQHTSPDDAELARQVELATRWLDSRLADNVCQGEP